MSKKYDVGLVTFWFANNYGAILTAYSLYHHLDIKGYKVLMIDKPQFWWPGFDKTKDPIARKFSDEYLTLSKSYANHDDIRELNNICDSFIVGSDQMWNYGLYESAGHYTFLDFVNTDKKKIAYATSYGHSNFLTSKDTELSTVSNYLKRFNAISVREETGVDISRNVFGVDSVCTLDAVFLTEFDHYNDLANESQVDVSEDYLFAYILDGNPFKADYIKRVAVSLNLNKIVLAIDAGDVPSGKKIDMDLEITEINSVNEWLKYLFNAKFVVTDSFHGCCFSIISKRQFIGIKNEGRGGTRFDSILSKVGLLNHLISENELKSDVVIPKKINYRAVCSRLSHYVDFSKSWLFSQLESPVEIKHVYPDGTLAKSIQEENSTHGLFVYRDYKNLGLKGKVRIDQIVDALPLNSFFQQAIGRQGEVFLDVPSSYGILKIFKATDYFVEISFTKNTMKTQSSEFYIARRVNRKVVGWTRFVSSEELEELTNKVNLLLREVEEIKKVNNLSSPHTRDF